MHELYSMVNWDRKHMIKLTKAIFNASTHKSMDTTKHTLNNSI